MGKTVDGKQKRKSVYGKTKSDVVNRMQAIQYEVIKGTYIDPCRATLEEWLIEWLETVARTKVKQTTFENYSTYIYKQIIPKIGHIPLKDLKAMHIQNLYNELLKNGRLIVRSGKQSQKGLSPRTVHLVHIVLHMAIEYAVKNDMISKNPVNFVTLPDRIKPEIKIFDEKNITNFIKAAKEEHFEVAFLLAICAGLRMGEILGLRWQDVDFDNKCLHIRQQLTVTKENGLTFSTPKTRSAIRKINIFNELIEPLKKHKRKQKEQRLSTNIWHNNDLVVCTGIGTPMYPNNLRRNYARMLKENYLPQIRFHDLRHTFASYWASKETSVTTLRTVLGHSNAAFTLNTYTHTTDDMVKADAEKVNRALAQALKYDDESDVMNTPF